MSVQLFGADIAPAPNAGHRGLAAIAKTVSVVVDVVHRIADEVVYTLREDFRHGQISRDPKDWER